MMISNLVYTTCMVRYPWPVDIMYDQGGEFLGHEFKNILIEEDFLRIIQTSQGICSQMQS